MSQERPVILNYDGSNFGPVPKTVLAGENDKILFRIGASAVADAKLRITINDAAKFSAKVLQHGHGQSGKEALQVMVKHGFDQKTSYKCELLDAGGGVISVSEGGGEIEPDTAGGASQ